MQGFVAKLPLRFTAATPKPRYPKKIKYIGDHLRARRIDLGLLQKEIAAKVGVDKATVTNRELGHTEPEERFILALICFLGYNPIPQPAAPGEEVRGDAHARCANARRRNPTLFCAPGRRSGCGRVRTLLPSILIRQTAFGHRPIRSARSS